jgi:hypothetical protein
VCCTVLFKSFHYNTVVKWAVNKDNDLELNTSPSHRKFINTKGYCVLLPVHQVYHISA